MRMGTAGRERVHVKEVDGFGNSDLDHHPPGVAVNQVGGPGVELVGQQQHRIVMAKLGYGELADVAGIARQPDAVIDDPWGAVSPSDIGESDALPRRRRDARRVRPSSPSSVGTRSGSECPGSPVRSGWRGW